MVDKINIQFVIIYKLVALKTFSKEAYIVR